MNTYKKMNSLKQKNTNININSRKFSFSSKTLKKLLLKDNDKINLENANLFFKFDKFFFDKAGNKIIKHNILNSEKGKKSIQLVDGHNNTDLIFKNKFLRDSNKNKNLQINIIDHEISSNTIMTAKRNKYSKNKYHIINDKLNSKNEDNKEKILDILRAQTKSNFNNKYKLLFKSQNSKKRNMVKNYFSIIKKNIKMNFGDIIHPKKHYEINNINNFNINKKIFDDINKYNKYNRIKKAKRSKLNIISIPIISGLNKKRGAVNISNNENINKSNNDDTLEKTEICSFYSTKNSIFQTQTNFRHNKMFL